MSGSKKYAYLYRLQFWFILLYIFAFFVLLGFKKFEWISNVYFPLTVLLFAVPIIVYKYKIKYTGPAHPDLNRLKDELQNVEMFAAVLAALFGAFTILFYFLGTN